jgi:hypothetical protein
MPPFFLDVWMEMAAQRQAAEPNKSATGLPRFTPANDDTPRQDTAKSEPSQA